MAKKKISVSAIETFADCPLKYKHQYIDQNYRPSNEHFVFGTFGHKILEYIGMGLSDDVIMTTISIDKEFAYVKRALETLKIYDVDELVKKYIAQLRSFLEDYEVITTEVKLEDADNVGVIDLVAVEKGTGKLLILDYKFSNYEKTEDDIEDNLQLYMYAKLLGKMNGLNAIIRKYEIDSVYVGYLGLSKIQPQPPKVLVSGKLSKSKSDKGVTYETYLKAIEDHNLDIEDYQDHLDYLKANNSESEINFVQTRLHRYALDEKIAEIEKWTKLIRYATKYDLFPGRNAWNCSKCDIKKQCKNHLGGK